MLSSDILKKIKHIEIHTKKVLANCWIGDSRSKQKGYGLEFEQLTDYQLGDDIRFIDWKSSARTGKLLIKEYQEERSRLIFLVVDFSHSSVFTTNEQSKKELIAHIASVLALIGNHAKDYVGLIIFSDSVETVIPPRRGNKHVHTIMTQLFASKIHSKKTAIKEAIDYINRTKRKNALVFLISDFIDTGYQESLRILNKHCEVIAIRCLDKNEYQLPAVGMVRTQDLESGQEIILDLRKQHNKTCSLLHNLFNEQTTFFKKNGIDYFDVSTNSDFILDMIRFMQRRIG